MLFFYCLTLALLLVGVNKNQNKIRNNKKMHSTGFRLGLLAFIQIAFAMTTAGPSTINRHSQGDIFSHQGFSISDQISWLQSRWWLVRYTSIQVPLANAMLRLVSQLLASAIMGVSQLPGLAAIANASAPWTDPSTGKTWSNASAPSTVSLFFVVVVLVCVFLCIFNRRYIRLGNLRLGGLVENLISSFCYI